MAGNVKLVGKNDVSLDDTFDPIFDDANAVVASVTTSGATIITPGAGCKLVRIVSDQDVWIRTDGTAAAAGSSGSTLILARVPEIVPVTPSTAVKGDVASVTATVVATPLKARA